MNVFLTPELERYVQDKVQSGRYHSASEVIREALQLMEEHEKIRAERLRDFRDELDRRLASLDKGETREGEQFFAELQARSIERRKRRA